VELALDLFPLEAAPIDRLRFPLTFTPSVTSYKLPHPQVRGLYFLTAKAKEFRENVRAIVLSQCGIMKPLRTDLLVDIKLYPPDARRRDCDNYQKVLFDSLQAAGVFIDDMQIQSFRVTKFAAVKGGVVIIDIWERK